MSCAARIGHSEAAAGLNGLVVAPFIVGAAVPWLVYGVRYALWWSAR